MSIFAVFAKKVEFWRGRSQGVRGCLERLKGTVKDPEALGKVEIHFYEDEEQEEKA